MAKIALTGATGFIGRHIARLLSARKTAVRVLARDPSRITLPDGAVEVVQGSLTDDRALAALVAGADTVIHCAGSVRGATLEQFNRVNADGTARLADIAGTEGCKRFLLLSSLAAREPQLSPYAASKRAGEEAVASAAGTMTWAAFRPPAVYGPGDKEMLPLFQLMARGIAPVFGSDKARFSLIYAPDLAAAIVAWSLYEAPPPIGIFELDDGKKDGYSWDDITRVVTALTGRPIRMLRIPPSLLGIPAAINWLLGRYLNRSPMLTPGKIRELRHPDWVCRTSPDLDALGWRPQHTLAEGLAATPGWQTHTG
jgi:nucleoside-diphosphate-sugar epimerase